MKGRHPHTQLNPRRPYRVTSEGSSLCEWCDSEGSALRAAARHSGPALVVCLLPAYRVILDEGAGE